jgi:hypothetical protein
MAHPYCKSWRRRNAVHNSRTNHVSIIHHSCLLTVATAIFTVMDMIHQVTRKTHVNLALCIKSEACEVLGNLPQDAQKWNQKSKIHQVGAGMRYGSFKDNITHTHCVPVMRRAPEAAGALISASLALS